MKLVIALTGSSGVVYGVRLVEILGKLLGNKELYIIITENAKKVIEYELGDLKSMIQKLSQFGEILTQNQIDAPISSGSSQIDAMIICPCSMKTAAKIAHGFADDLVCRSADVILKEGKKLILVPRETPLNTIHLRNLLTLAKMDVCILPASPAFYYNPKNLNDMVDFIVGKILDQLKLEHKLYKKWRE